MGSRPSSADDHRQEPGNSNKDTAERTKGDLGKANETNDIMRPQRPVEERDTHIKELIAGLHKIDDKFQQLKEENSRLKNENWKLSNDLRVSQNQFSTIKAQHQSDLQKAEKKNREKIWKLEQAKRLSEEDNKGLSNTLRLAQDKCLSLESQLESESKRVKTRDDRIADLEQAKLRLEDEKKALWNTIQEAQDNYLTSKNQLEGESRRLQREIETRENRITAIEMDNSKFRRQIQNADAPMHGQNHYAEIFYDLKNEIASWVASHSKRNAGAILTSAVQNTVLEKLTLLGNHGMRSVSFLRPHFLQLYHGKSTRIPLLRHIFALFLFDQIFDPFAFGFTRDASNYLKYIEDQLFKQGSLFPRLCLAFRSRL